MGYTTNSSFNQLLTMFNRPRKQPLLPPDGTELIRFNSLEDVRKMVHSYGDHPISVYWLDLDNKVLKTKFSANSEETGNRVAIYVSKKSPYYKEVHPSFCGVIPVDEEFAQLKPSDFFGVRLHVHQDVVDLPVNESVPDTAGALIALAQKAKVPDKEALIEMISDPDNYNISEFGFILHELVKHAIDFHAEAVTQRSEDETPTGESIGWIRDLAYLTTVINLLEEIDWGDD